jgi:VanZ family protein
MAAIFAASSVPNLTRLPGDVDDHTAHFAAYAVLAGVCLRALAGGAWRGVTWRRAAGAWLLTVAYGVSDELHQIAVPGRFAAFDDVIADALGAAAAGVTVLVVAAILGQRRQGRAV